MTKTIKIASSLVGATAVAAPAGVVGYTYTQISTLEQFRSKGLSLNPSEKTYLYVEKNGNQYEPYNISQDTFPQLNGLKDVNAEYTDKTSNTTSTATFSYDTSKGLITYYIPSPNPQKPENDYEGDLPWSSLLTLIQNDDRQTYYKNQWDFYTSKGYEIKNVSISLKDTINLGKDNIGYTFTQGSKYNLKTFLTPIENIFVAKER